MREMEPWDGPRDPDERYAEDAAYQRLMELIGLAGRDGLDDEDGRHWCLYLEELSTMEDEDMNDDLDTCVSEGDEYNVGWFEDTRGGAVYLERSRGGDKDE